MAIFSWILGFVSKIIAEVLKDALKTPAREISIEPVEGPLDSTISTNDELYDQYKWVRNRGEREG